MAKDRMARNRKRANPDGPGPEMEVASPLKRIVKIETIRDGQEEIIEPTEAEREEIAALQDLSALEGFVCTYTLRKASGGSVRFKGRLEAKATQPCVVTLEPVQQTIDMPLDAEFWPLTRIRAIEREQAELGSVEDPLAEFPEPIVDGTIDVGRLVYETFALALDPYPRQEGAELDWENRTDNEDDAQDARENPFAALEQLKRN